MRFTFSNLPAIGWTLPAGRIADLASLCEAVGFDRFAVADYPFHYDCTTVMTACLLATRRLVVESLVTDPYRRHPSLSACAWATMANLAPGRVIFGIGAGVESGSTVWVDGWGRERPRPVQAVREAVDIARGIWSGEDVVHDGPLLRAEGAKLKFPAPGPASIPVLIAARGPRMLRLAGEIADIAHLASLFADVDHQRSNLAEVSSGAARAGRSLDDLEIDLSVTVSVSTDRQQARRAARRTAAQTILWMAGAERFSRQRKEWRPPPQLDVPESVVDALSTRWDMWREPNLPDDLAALISDDVLDKFAVAGEPDECAERLRELQAGLPNVTGLRVKLAPPVGEHRFEYYATAIEALGEVIKAVNEPVAALSARGGSTAGGSGRN